MASHGEPRYPLRVALPGGRVRHSARLIGDGPAVTTLCRKRGTPVGDGSALAYCRACAARPNPMPLVAADRATEK
ncbi:hypothetical protein AB0L55_36900 [Streptomyces anthocyanicus]|uniref:hypothetical protein n=1 Tax=Streptomyces anthocyanicus TaxID=68174 RepID=UPI0034261205